MILLAVVVLTAHFSVSGVFAQRYHARTYSLEDGLPQSMVTSIVQDDQGFLWFGSMGGLSRFDGQRFTTFGAEDGLNSSIVNALDPNHKLTETHESIKQIRDVRAQVKGITGRLPDDLAGKEQIDEAGKALIKKITGIEEALYQTKNQSRQDPLNFPIRLNNKLAAVAGIASSGDYRPTDQAISVKNTLTAQIIVGDDSMSVPFEIKKDPRASSSVADLQAQFDFLVDIRDKLTETHESIKQIRDVRAQVKGITGRLPDDLAGKEQIDEAGKALIKKITGIEEALYQTKNQSRQDPLNFPIRLNNKLAAVAGIASSGDYRPTDQAISVKNTLTAQIDAQLAKLQEVMDTDLPAFNQMVRDAAVPAVIVDTKKATALPGTN